MTESMTPGRALRDAAGAETMQVPGAPFALAGRLIERMGYPAVYLSSSAFSAGIVGLPDVGLCTLTELAQHTNYLTRNLNIPTIVDAGSGFGDVMNVERTVIELEAAGAAAIQLVDRQLPQRCGHLADQSLIEPAAMAAKIRAAVTARLDPDTVILARTAARGVGGVAAALDRAKRYMDAGADWICPDALADESEFELFANQLSVPLVANMTEFDNNQLHPVAMFRQLEYAGVIYPVSLLRIAMRAFEAALAVIEDDGTQAELLDLMQTRDELQDLLDYDEFDQRDRAYLSG